MRARWLEGIAAVAAKELKELIRDPISISVALLLPVALLFIFGYALRLDLRQVGMAVLDRDHSPASRELEGAFDRTKEFEVTQQAETIGDVEELLSRGIVRLVLIVPPGFGRDIEKGERVCSLPGGSDGVCSLPGGSDGVCSLPGGSDGVSSLSDGSDGVEVQILVDGSFSATARVIAGYADALVASFAAQRQRSTSRLGSPIETRVLYNPELDSVISVVPGLFGVILMAFPPLLTALAVVREKERGTYKQILISPLSPIAFVLGKLVPYAGLAFADLVLVLGAGILVFDIPVQGSLLFLLGAAVLYVFATLGVGLFVSAVTRTQIVALLLVLVVTVMPSFMFSGFLYPIFTMPRALQLYTQLFPGRYFVAVSRGVFLKGVGLEVLYPSLLLLFSYAALMVTIAVWRLRRRAG